MTNKKRTGSRRSRKTLEQYINRYIKNRGCLINTDDENFSAHIEYSDNRHLSIIISEESIKIDKLYINYLAFKTVSGDNKILDAIKLKGDISLSNKTKQPGTVDIKNKYGYQMPTNLSAPKAGQICNVFFNNGKVLKNLKLVSISTYEILFQRIKEGEPITDVLIFKHSVNRVEYVRKDTVNKKGSK